MNAVRNDRCKEKRSKSLKVNGTRNTQRDLSHCQQTKLAFVCSMVKKITLQKKKTYGLRAFSMAVSRIHV